MDSLGQFGSQIFTLVFNANQSPVPDSAAIASYKIIIGEGRTHDYILASNLLNDPDGDRIYYEFLYFGNFSTVDNSWAKFIPGYEGESKIQLTNVPLAANTNTQFGMMYSYNIGTSSGPLFIQMQFNNRPKLTNPTLSSSIYPNDTFIWDIDISPLFTDDDGDSLSYSFTSLPTGFSINQQSGTTYRVLGSDATSVSSAISFDIIADDGISEPMNLPVTINPQVCHTN